MRRVEKGRKEGGEMSILGGVGAEDQLYLEG